MGNCSSIPVSRSLGQHTSPAASIMVERPEPVPADILPDPIPTPLPADPLTQDPGTLPALYREQPYLGWWLRFLTLNKQAPFTADEFETIRASLLDIAELCSTPFFEPAPHSWYYEHLVAYTKPLAVLPFVGGDRAECTSYLLRLHAFLLISQIGKSGTGKAYADRLQSMIR